MISTVVFWTAVALVAYAYGGYFFALRLLSGVRRLPTVDVAFTPSVSLIITARNEEARIEQKIKQSLALDYPQDRLEVVVASDCSTDRTNDIIRSFASQGVTLVVAQERRGKEFAQQLAIEASTGDVLVFSDVATRLDSNCLRQMARHFSDKSIGAVSSVDRLVAHDGTVSAEGLYVRYEMRLRALESAVSTLVGLSGSLFAARRSVCAPWAVDLPSDFNVMLNSLKLGLRGVSDPTAVGYYQDLADPTREYERKVRTVTRGMTSLARHVNLMNPFRHGLVAWQLFSHKLCRWLVPIALIAMMFSSAVLAVESPFFRAVAVLQLAAYGAAAIGYTRQERLSGPMRAAVFFVVANVSILHAWLNLLRGRRIVTWEPSVRPGGGTAPGAR